MLSLERDREPVQDVGVERPALAAASARRSRSALRRAHERWCMSLAPPATVAIPRSFDPHPHSPDRLLGPWLYLRSGARCQARAPDRRSRVRQRRVCGFAIAR